MALEGPWFHTVLKYLSDLGQVLAKAQALAQAVALAP